MRALALAALWYADWICDGDDTYTCVHERHVPYDELGVVFDFHVLRTGSVSIYKDVDF